MLMFSSELQFNSDLEKRLGDVLEIAVSAHDNGVVEWVGRAHADAEHLGHIRDKDYQTLVRLERTYQRDFYRNGECRSAVYA